MGGQEVIRTVEELIETNSPPTYDEWKATVSLYQLSGKDNKIWNARFPRWHIYIDANSEAGRVARQHARRYKDEFGDY